ncbi:MAG: isoprenyl transferase [Eubacterium sp.]|nr:isoprenyl transferase [Eubacterium sp.]
MEKELNGKLLKIPQHVAIILDGNGRWAKKHFMPRNVGHSQGAKAVEQICEDAWDIGIKYLTVYAFSTENWSRPEKEVSALMKLLRRYLRDCIERTSKNNMRVRIIGEKSRLAEDIRAAIDELEEVSSVNTGLNFTIALNYGSRDEIVRAVRSIVRDSEDGLLSADDITEDLISRRLDTKDIPDPDLLIRTSGEQRLSNWLLWQMAYTEFYFTDILWPDFNKEQLIRAVEYYNTRERRFGGVK